MFFHVRWPDGSLERCYSPSLVIKDYFEPGVSYRLPDFVARSRTALQIANRRVQEKYGFACGQALAQMEKIEQAAAGFDTGAQVTIEAFEE
jgi:uncharacterized repeat protein (TIGR04042 family)